MTTPAKKAAATPQKGSQTAQETGPGTDATDPLATRDEAVQVTPDEDPDDWDEDEDGESLHDRLDRIIVGLPYSAEGNAIRDLVELVRDGASERELGKRTNDPSGNAQN